LTNDVYVNVNYRQVRKAGRTITVAQGEARAIGADGAHKLIATMTGTLMTVRSRDRIQG